VQADRQRLGQGRVLDRDVVGDRKAAAGLDVQGLDEAALHVRALAGAAHEEDVAAQVEPRLVAARADAAGPRRVDRDPLAEPQVAPRGGPGAAQVDDLAGDLVAEDQRLDHLEAAGPAVQEVVQVGAADAAAAEAHPDLARGQRLLLDLLEAQVVGSVQDGCERHGFLPFPLPGRQRSQRPGRSRSIVYGRRGPIA